MVMTVGEMHTMFKHLFDKQSNFSSPEVTPEEIDLYLNLSYNDLLTALTKEGIERTQDWVDYTRNITKSYSFVPFSNASNKPYGSFVPLPSDFRVALLEQVDIQHQGCHTVETINRLTVRPVTRDQYSKIIFDPFAKPWKEEVLKLSNEAGIIELIGNSGLTVTRYYLDYIIEPDPIKYGTQYSPPQVSDVDCQLEKKAATELVYMAVNKALQTLGDQRLPLVQFNPLIKTI